MSDDDREPGEIIGPYGLPRRTRFAVLDLETTGLDVETDRIVEIGVVTVDIDAAGIAHHGAGWDSLVRPDQPVRAESIHGIRDAMVADAPPFGALAGPLLALLARRVIVAHNLAFDAGFLRAALSREDIVTPDPLAHGICTLTMARAALGAGSFGLAACCARFDISYQDRHTALGDARATAALLVRLLRRTGQVAGRPFPAVALNRPAVARTLSRRAIGQQHSLDG